MPTRLTTQQFIEKAIRVHGNQFCYERSIYIDRLTKVEIFCNTCKTIFFQTPHQHIHAKNGCKHCAIKKLQTFQTKTHDDFICQATEIHNSQYEYLTRYVSAHIKIKMRHILCGHVFDQTPNAHLSHKRGCPKCGIEKRTNALKKHHDDFIKQANKIHNNQFVYLDKYVSDSKKITMRHILCGHIFKQKASCHLQGNGCPNCHTSKGEKMIKRWLEERNVVFLYQHKFAECFNPKTNRMLKFDFYLPNHNTAIEFDGLQHYQPVRFFGKMSKEQADLAFSKQKELDHIKNEFCKKNNIELVRIGCIRNKIDSEKIDQVLLEVIE